MWTSLVKDEIWYTEDFVEDALVDEVLDHIKESETKELAIISSGFFLP